MEGSLSHIHVITMIITLLLVTLTGVYSGRKIKSNDDFAHGGNKAGTGIVIGTIVGTLVGGSSTVATAQMAFIYGLSAWWFTLGAAIGCLILGAFYVKPMRDSGAKTVPQILSGQYGSQAGLFSGIFSSFGIFLNIVAQMLSVVALLSAMFHLNPYLSAVVGVSLMAFYVVFGGVWGTGMVGMVKLVLVYGTVMLAGLLAYFLAGGLTGLREVFPAYPWFSLFGRGLEKDLSAGFSLVVGVLSTQTYVQAILAGKDLSSSRRGAWVSAAMILPIGLASVLIGLFMKANFPETDPATVFPIFVMKFLNPWVGGVTLATLLISVIGCGAGLALGVGTILSEDIYRQYFAPQADEKRILGMNRFFICLVLVLALFFVSGNMKSLILQWSFLSMGLRGATCFIPMTAALFMKGRVSKEAGIRSILLGPLSVLVWELWSPVDIDSLIVGIGVSFLVMLGGSFYHKESSEIKG